MKTKTLLTRIKKELEKEDKSLMDDFYKLLDQDEINSEDAALIYGNLDAA